jgi:hypothetical protein
MPRGEYHKVGGRQAREALEHGWVKVDRATAARLFERGMPVTATGTRVHPAHFGKMSVTIDPQDRRWRGVDFDAALGAIERGLGEHPSLGQGLALFVYEGEYPLAGRATACRRRRSRASCRRSCAEPSGSRAARRGKRTWRGAGAIRLPGSVTAAGVRAIAGLASRVCPGGGRRPCPGVGGPRSSRTVTVDRS